MASGNSRLRRGLVVAQVALCFLMLLTAGVFIRGMATAGTPPPHAPHTLLAQLRFDVLDKYVPAERRAFLDAFEARMRADARVRGIGYTSDGPASGGIVRVWRSGDQPDAGKFADAVHVAGDFFNIVGVRVLRGRALTTADAGAATAVMVNEAFVAKFELAEPVVGQSVRIAPPGERDTAARHVTIIGVTSQQASVGVPDPLAEPKMYLPLGAVPGDISAWISADNAAQLTDVVRRVVSDLDLDLPVVAVRTLEDVAAASDEPLRLVARTAGGLGMAALLLAVSGLYSVIAFFVALRTNEFGIRVALGARSADIVRMVLGQALRLAGLGLAIGALLGTPLLIALHANFPFTQPFDPAVVLPTALLLALTALLAGWVPARRASSIQASEALRAE